jgi:hypothetical protein
MEKPNESASRDAKLRRDSDFHHCLKQYAVAALGVAGTSTMVAAQVPADHIQYTPASIFLTEGKSMVIPIDFNHDGITDITLRVSFYTFGFSGHGGFNYTGIFAVPTAGNLAIGGHAIPQGVPLSLGGIFKGSEQRMAFTVEETTSYGNSSHFGGAFNNVTNEYLGVEFQIANQPHSGWIRISMLCRGSYCYGGVTGYAYETTSGKSLEAGQLRSAETARTTIGEATPGSLGMLATGFSPCLIGEELDFPTNVRPQLSISVACWSA